MRHLILFCLFILFLVSVQFSQAQTVDEIIEKHLEAMGGKDKLLALQSVKAEGIMNANGFDINIVNTTVHKTGMRLDISVPGMGEGYRIVTTSKGWSFMPFNGQSAPEEMNESDVKEAQIQLDVQGTLLNYKEKGHTVELLGKEKVEQADCYKLRIKQESGREITLFLNAATYYREKQITPAKAPDGTEQLMETTYSNYKKNADGYVFAFTQTNERGTITFNSIETNKPIDTKLFTPN